MADYESKTQEIHLKKHMVILDTYPQSYVSELNKATAAIVEQYQTIHGRYPEWDDAIKVVTSDDDIILYFEEDISCTDTK